MSNAEDLPTLPKTEPSREGSFSLSPSSSPEPELGEQTSLTENVQVQKRKGGRKPIYATSEERKQRNRQAQAAFRERRTEYIKQLEANIKQQDETLQALQQSHRTAADECLMLRYKNSLLERVLLEKGVDVQAELKSISEPGPGRLPSTVPQQTPVQRAIMNQQQNARRSVSRPSPRLLQAQKSSSGTIPSPSPQLQPTPPSQTSSPTTSRSPNFAVQGGMMSPHPGLQQQQPQHLQQQQQPHQQMPSSSLRSNHYQPLRPFPGIAIPTSGADMQATNYSPMSNQQGTGRSSAVGPRSNPWPSPYQTHMEQLEQEYDAHADMVDDQDPSDHSAGPGPYPKPFHEQPFPPAQQLPMNNQPQSMMQPPTMLQPGDPRAQLFGTTNQMFDPYDPMLDADPFGLTASMQFPTQFSFQESAMRK